MNNYYTYAYLREDGTPYYIGKGKGNRITSNQRSLNKPSNISKIIYLKQNLTENEAFKHEIYMIALFGRKDKGTGILRNCTDGGEGGSGIILSEETKRKISEAMKKREITDKTRSKLSVSLKNNTNGVGNRGKKRTEEFREYLRKLKTKPDNEVTSHALYMREYRKEKLKYSDKERKEIRRQKQIEKQTKTYQITFDDGRSIIVDGLRKFAKENGYSSGLFNVMNGTYKKHKDIVAVEKLNTDS
jgi:hypothetical protein